MWIRIRDLFDAGSGIEKVGSGIEKVDQGSDINIADPQRCY
jgi:hypothetical protein